MIEWVLFAGAPGTGKSTLAQTLATRMAAAVLDKDAVRGVLFPGPLTDYSAEQDELCIRAMLEAAVYITTHALTPYIFFDGRTFSKSSQIAHVVRTAEQAGAGWRIVHVTCADEVAEERLSRKEADHPAKNRDAALYRRIKQHFEPIVHPCLTVDTTAGIEGVLASVANYLTGSK